MEKLVNDVKMCHIVSEKDLVGEFGAAMSDVRRDL